MEDTRNVQSPGYGASTSIASEPKRRRTSILAVLLRLAVAVAIVFGAGYFALSMVGNRPEPPQRQARERSFTVAVTEPVVGTYSPQISSFGQIVAGRSIDVRAQASGEVTDVSSNLVAGGTLTAGETMVEIDRFEYEGAVNEALAALADARLTLAEAEAQVDLQQVALELAQRQQVNADRDLERARALLESGSITSQEVEAREVAAAEADQAVRQAGSTLTIQRTNVARQRALIEQADWQLQQARRALAGTTIRAPFNAVVVTETAEVGRVFTQNESVATLYDADSLEVRFTLADQQYGQLTNAGLIGREVTVVWDIEPEPIELQGRISRAGAEVDPALGGVEMFASLVGEARTPLRPGTFVEVLVDGLDYPDSLLLPETALYENDHFYVIRDQRMARVDAELLTRDDDELIVRADLSEGDRIITTRLAQAGEGVLVTVEGEEPMQVFGGRPGAGNRPADGAGAEGGGQGTPGDGGGG